MVPYVVPNNYVLTLTHSILVVRLGPCKREIARGGQRRVPCNSKHVTGGQDAVLATTTEQNVTLQHSDCHVAAWPKESNALCALTT